jgi:hypothetical protein
MAPRPADIKERFNIPFWVGIIFRNCTPSKLGILEASHFLGFLLRFFAGSNTLKFVQFNFPSKLLCRNKMLIFFAKSFPEENFKKKNNPDALMPLLS